LSTPAADRSGSSTYQSSNKSGHGFTHKQAKNVDPKQKKKPKFRPPTKPKEKDEIDKLYDESEAHLTEIMTNYRDRAAERRKGEVDGQDVELRAKLTSGLRAFREDDDSMAAADRREQEIRESKYLGGDIEVSNLF
jgi:IK cytokine